MTPEVAVDLLREALFLVIIIDAVFSVIFSQTGW